MCQPVFATDKLQILLHAVDTVLSLLKEYYILRSLHIRRISF